MFEAILLSDKDNVATAIRNLKEGKKVRVSVKGRKELEEIKLKEEIPFGHKFAVRKIGKGDEIIKYGELIGKATKSIDVGEYVHVHNVESTRGRGDWSSNR